MGKQTNVHARNGRTDISLTHHESDSPLLPVAQIEKLYQLSPARAEWVFDQTQVEAEHRRKQSSLRDLFIFAERIFSLVLLVGLCLVAIYVAYLVAMAGHEGVAIAVGCTAPVGLFGAFFTKTIKQAYCKYVNSKCKCLALCSSRPASATLQRVF